MIIRISEVQIADYGMRKNITTYSCIYKFLGDFL